MFRVDYINSLLNKGFDVIVIAPNDCNYSRRSLEVLGVKIHYIPSIKKKVDYVKVIFWMNYYILRYRGRTSVFICHFISTFIISYFSLIPFNSRCIIYIEGLGSVFSKNAYLQFLLRLFLVNNNVKRVFCNHDEKNILGKSDDFVSGGIGVDLNYFTFTDRSDNKPVYELLYVGRLIEDKGIWDVIYTLRYLRNENLNVTLNLVGDIYPNNPTSLCHNDILKLKKEFGSCINFVGFTQNVREWYEKSDVLLLPSKREGFPVCVMEANATGLPAICYDVPGCCDAIKVGVNGYLVEPCNRDKYASTVARALIENRLSSMNRTSSDYANENFNKNSKSLEFVKLIKSLFS